MNAIAGKAMLAAIHISQWTARKHDRSVSREVANTHKSAEKLGRYNKRLLAEATKLDAVQSLAGKIRTYFYDTTLPWADDGLRILPNALYFDLTARMKEFEQEFHEAVEDFLEEYPSYVEATRPLLNGLWCAEDYPTADQLRAKFGLKVEIMPLGTAEDFRVDMAEADKSVLKEKYNADAREHMARSNRDLWFRTYDVIAHFASRLRDPEARLHASTFAKVAEMADILPKLNITDDPALKELAIKVKTELCQFSVDTLRNSQSLRSETAVKASTLAHQMDAMLKELSVQPQLSEGKPEETEMPLPFRSGSCEVFTPPPTQSVDEMFAHMSGYMGSEQGA